MSVPPPPTGVAVPPPPPAAVPTAPTATGAVAAVKPGGIALDMSDLFGPPKSNARKSLPPWERRKGKTPPQPPSAQPPLSAVTTASNLVLFTAKGSSYPSLPSLLPPTSAQGGEALQSMWSLAPHSQPAASAGVPAPAKPTPQSSAAGPLAQEVLTPINPPAVRIPVSDMPEVPTPPPPPPSQLQPQPPGAPGPVPIPPAAAPLSADGAPAPPVPPSTQPVVSVAATAEVTPSGPLLPTPSISVVAPRVVFQNEEHQVVVAPMRPIPQRHMPHDISAAAKKTRQSGSKAGTKEKNDNNILWVNRYDLQPSPSCAAELHHTHPLALYASTSTTRRQWTSAGVVNSAKANSSWRGVHWQHTDVHRYIARRYFGSPPPTEQ